MSTAAEYRVKYEHISSGARYHLHTSCSQVRASDRSGQVWAGVAEGRYDNNLPDAPGCYVIGPKHSVLVNIGKVGPSESEVAYL
eukprot:COSAG02_NODE_895_length_16129_cov_25.044604_11_plen_84_part_00